MHISPVFFEKPTPFLHLSFVHCTFTLHFNMCLWISAGSKFLAFKNRITDRNSQVAKLLIFVFIFNYDSEWGKNYDSVVCNTRVPRDIHKATDLPKKCARQLCVRYSQLVLTFQTRLVLLLITTTITNTNTITTTPQLVIVPGLLVFVVQNSTVGTWSSFYS